MIIAIDPGINATGWCILKDDKTIYDVGTIRARRTDNWETRAEYICSTLRKLSEDCDYAVIEEPSPKWTRGRRNHEALMKLQRLITRIVEYISPVVKDIEYINADEISKPRIKDYDSLQDYAVKRYIELTLGKEVSEHARDAYRIGLYWLNNKTLDNLE